MEKIKPTLNGAAETMLQSFYARAKYSKSKNCKFYDARLLKLLTSWTMILMTLTAILPWATELLQGL